MIARRPARCAALAVAGLLALSACSSAADGLSSRSPAAESNSASAATDVTEAAESLVFDSTRVHEISVEFDTAEYLEMIGTYADTGDKEWIEAVVTIDGTTYEQVGLRLKGNSSLFGLSADGTTGAGLSADDPEDLPWLIRLDKYVDDQNHEGVVDLVVRSNNTETALNEAVALDLLDAAGLASQDAMAVRFSVNGSEESLRLVIEHPDDQWMEEHFDADGALYKAESTGDYSYRGEDPDSYDEVFDQEAGDDNADLTPLIEFLEFINDSDDETFAADLDDWLDTESFATYLAMQELIGNFDDIDGPGNNSYLYYDPGTGRFTVVPWDHNLAFGVTNGGGMGGRGGERGPGQPPTGDVGTGELPALPGDVGTGEPPALPGDVGTGELPAFPDDVGPGEGRPIPGGDGEIGEAPTPPGDGGPGMGGIAGSNVLVERFLAVAEYADLYEEQLTSLRADLFDSGYAAEVLADWVAVLESGASDLVSTDVIASEAAALDITA